MRGEELPLPLAKRQGWYGIEFGVTPEGRGLAPGEGQVSGQVWSRAPNPRRRPDTAAAERLVVEALDELYAAAPKPSGGSRSS